MTQTKLLKAAGLGHEISAREAWKLFVIMAEFFEATERLAGVRPSALYYRLAVKAARLLSQARFAVFSGGGMAVGLNRSARSMNCSKR